MTELEKATRNLERARVVAARETCVAKASAERIVARQEHRVAVLTRREAEMSTSGKQEAV